MDDKAGKQAISLTPLKVWLQYITPQSKQPSPTIQPVNARRQHSRFARGENERRTHVRWWSDVEETKISEWKKKMNRPCSPAIPSLFLEDSNNDDVRRHQPESRIPASFLPVKLRHSGPPKLRCDKPTTLQDDNRMVDNEEAAGCN
ncbi:hypothetical protein EAF00_006859 [Botryotinia globosa]|nr:hypothetical protein EAF00_006859 [Botryotinia globosa]